MEITEITFALRNDGLLLFGEAAENEIRNFPNDIVYSGKATDVSGLPELVGFALRAEFRLGCRITKG